MKAKKMEQIYEKNESGRIINHTMELVEDNKKRPHSVLENPIISILILPICLLADTICVINTQSYIVYDSLLILILTTLGLLIGLDLAPIYLGKALKNRSQGLNASKAVIAVLFAAFVIAASFNMALRISVKDLVLPDFSTSATSMIGEAQQSSSGSNITLLYAIFVGAIPIITSFASFGVSFNTANPLKDTIIRLRNSKKALEDAIIETEAILSEYGSDKNSYERLISDDEEKYYQTIEMIEEKAVYFADYVREMIKEKLGDTVANNVLSKDTRLRLLKMINEDYEADEPAEDETFDDSETILRKEA